MTGGLTINGKNYPLKFSLKALREFGRLTGHNKYAELATLGENMTLEEVVIFIWCGLKYGAEEAKMEFPFTQDNMWDILDADQSLMANAFGEYRESMPDATGEEKKTAT